MTMPEVLYHYTSRHAARQAAQDRMLRIWPPMPPRWADRRAEVPDVIYLTASPIRSQQRWADVPDTGLRGMSYLDRAEFRIAVRCDQRLGAMPVPFRTWAVEHDLPPAWIAEIAKGGSTEDWYILEREIPVAEWHEVAVWNRLGYVQAFVPRTDGMLLND